MSVCESIDTLSMAYLDDELAAEERHELEAHLTECAGCRSHLDGERSEQEMLQNALAAPPAPDMLRARVARALDAEDRTQRKRWTSWMLPGSAMIAAAAAIAVFVGVRPADDTRVGAVAREAVKQQSRSLPLEVQGASTGQWLRQNFAPTVQPPQLFEDGAQVVGARLFPRGVAGHDAAKLDYRVLIDGQPVIMSVLIIRDVREDEFGGTEAIVGDRTMHVLQFDGSSAVGYVDSDHMGYLFYAPQLPADTLVWLVGRTSLVMPPR